MSCKNCIKLHCLTVLDQYGVPRERERRLPWRVLLSVTRALALCESAIVTQVFSDGNLGTCPDRAMG